MRYAQIYAQTTFEGMSLEDLHDWYVTQVLHHNPTFSLFPEGKIQCPDTGIMVKATPNKTVINIMKRTGFSEPQLRQAFSTSSQRHNERELKDPSKTALIVPNKHYGPLSYEQKAIIHEHLKGENSQILAHMYNTNPSNIKTAQQGRFKQHQEKLPPLANPTPLTLAQKIHIRDNCQGQRPVDLAHEYNTNINNVCIALKGSFKEPQNKVIITDRPYGPLTQDEKELIYTTMQHRTITDIAAEYNTNHGNVRNALLGRFKSDSIRQRQLEVARALPREIIEEVYNEHRSS